MWTDESKCNMDNWPHDWQAIGSIGNKKGRSVYNNGQNQLDDNDD